MNQVTIIFGPTASGKTQLATKLAQEQGASLLSFDSRHIYKEMDIVTGKDRPVGIPADQIFGFDLVNPDEAFSIRHFYEYAAPIVAQHFEKNTPLILFGGSWLYAQALIDPPNSLFAPTDTALRSELTKNSLMELQSQAQALNPERWNAMNESDRANSRRLIRLIEVAMNPECGSGEPPLITDFSLQLIEPSREEIDAKILARVKERWHNGALAETEYLIKKYPDWNHQAFSSTGYKYIRQFLEGKMDEEEAQRLWFTQERQYAKRQFTWVRKLKGRFN